MDKVARSLERVWVLRESGVNGIENSNNIDRCYDSTSIFYM
jgi:hypothetical protein